MAVADPVVTVDSLGREGLRVVLSAIPGLTAPGAVPAGGFVFQCPPLEEFSRNYSFSHTDYQTANGGQYSRPGGVDLTTFDFQTLAVDGSPVYTIGEDPLHIEDFTEQLITICTAGTPVLLTAAHEIPRGNIADVSLTFVGPEIQMPVTLRTLKVTEKAGEGDSRYFDCAFTEYRDPLVHVRAQHGKKRAGGTSFPITVYLFNNGVIQRKDTGRTMGSPTNEVTLADLAQHFYKDPKLAPVIAKANGIKNWGSHTSLRKYPGFASGSRKFALRRGVGTLPSVSLTIPKPPGKKKK